MAQPGAVIDVVGAEACSDQLLEQIGLFIAALGATEARQSLAPPVVPEPAQSVGGGVQGLLPAGFPEMVMQRLGGDELGGLGRARFADQRRRQPRRVARVIKPVAALDAETPPVRGAVSAGHILNLVIFDMEAQQATHAAVGADGIHPLVRGLQAGIVGGHQRASGASLHTLAAGHAGAFSQGVAHVEHDLRMFAPVGVADDIVDLLLPAGAHATGAVYAGVQVDGDGGMGQVRGDRLARREAGREHLEPGGPGVQFRVWPVGGRALLRHVRQQQFQHHFL